MRARIKGDQGVGAPVIYVPGIDGTGDLMLGTAERLSARFRLIRVSYESEPSDRAQPSGYQDLGTQIADLAAAAGLDSYLILSESFGGGVALQMALDRPSAVRGVMLINSFAYFPWRGLLAFSRLTSGLIPRWAFDLGRRLFAVHSLMGQRREADALRRFRELDGAFFDVGYRGRLRLIAGLDLRPRLAEIQQPVALVYGDHDRVVPSAQTMGVLHRALPDAELELVPGGGHLILPLESEPWGERLERLAARAGL